MWSSRGVPDYKEDEGQRCEEGAAEHNEHGRKAQKFSKQAGEPE